MDAPPDKAPAPRRWFLRPAVLLAIPLIVGIVVLLGVTVRLPAYSVEPGPARDVGALIRVDGQEIFPSRGKLLLMTVSVSNRPITLFEGLRAWLDSAVRVVDRSAIIQPGLDDRGQDIVNRHDIEHSKLLAQVAAFREMGHDVRPSRGARILTIVPDSPADGSLREGDLLVEVDGVAIRDPEAAGELVRRHRIGDAVELTVVRDGSRHRFELRTQASFTDERQPSVGVTLAAAYRLPFEVQVDTGRVGGPSGGLIFSLAIVDALGEEDLTRGYQIAGTGTIAADGTVGDVGGIDEKILAAERAGADIFLVPKVEAERARDAASAVRVIGVGSLREALEALRRLPPASEEAA